MARRKSADSEGMQSKKMGAGNFANMPTEVIMKSYRKCPYGMGEGLNDTIEGIDANSTYNTGKVRSSKKGMF